MTLDPDLLRTARAAAERLSAAEREALLARDDYHTAVRRLHLRGGSLREIATGLDLSHQRVQQIVSAAGGSWWRRAWRGRRVVDAGCTWCGRPPAEVNKLIAGPHVYICDACVADAEHPSAKGRFVKISERAGRKCSFCSKRASGDRQLLGSQAGYVCNECLRVCREILDGSTSDSKAGTGDANTD